MAMKWKSGAVMANVEEGWKSGDDPAERRRQHLRGRVGEEVADSMDPDRRTRDPDDSAPERENGAATESEDGSAHDEGR
jgi:hypothetical protein